jgi:dynein heavy chain
VQASPDGIEDDKTFIRLWAHECSRVFYDRLINDADRTWFWKTLGSKCRDHFRKDWIQIRGEHDVLFCNFTNPRAVKKPYLEVLDRDGLVKVCVPVIVGLMILQISISVTTACTKRTGAAAGAERR